MGPPLLTILTLIIGDESLLIHRMFAFSRDLFYPLELAIMRETGYRLSASVSDLS